MRPLKLLAGAAAVAALATLPATSASAGWYRHHDDCFILALPFCIAGAVVGTAAVVATAPFVVAGEVLDPGPRWGYGPRPRPYRAGPWAYYDGPRAAYFRERPYYGPPATDYPLPHRWARRFDGPPPDYDGPPPRGGDGPPRGYYGGPPRGYDGPPRGYDGPSGNDDGPSRGGPPQGDDGPQSNY